jgi:tetratricopeptide (TPR) repeat protein
LTAALTVASTCVTHGGGCGQRYTMPLTWARNADWIDDITLYESDYSRLDDKRSILTTLVAAHLRENNIQRAVEICDAHTEAMLEGVPASIHCGSAYGRAGRYADAEQIYLAAATANDGRQVAFARVNLAMLYLHLGRKSDAENQFELGITAQNQKFLREYFSALRLIQLYPSDRTKLIEARTHLEKALDLQPQHVESRQELEALNARLAPAKSSEP